jgi:hypothetical protein
VGAAALNWQRLRRSLFLKKKVRRWVVGGPCDVPTWGGVGEVGTSSKGQYRRQARGAATCICATARRMDHLARPMMLGNMREQDVRPWGASRREPGRLPLQPDDVVVVTKLDRLGRSTRELLELIDRIGKAGARSGR